MTSHDCYGDERQEAKAPAEARRYAAAELFRLERLRARRERAERLERLPKAPPRDEDVYAGLREVFEVFTWK